jgi:MoaA/NifB/PqqE/SkfB family radical SAM enzyme
MAQAIRQEILQGRYYYCNTSLCRFFNQFESGEFQLNAKQEDQPLPFESNTLTQVQKIPANIIFDFDPTCNLRCPSCRLEVINYNKHTAMRAKNDNISEKIKHLIIDEIGDNGPVTIRWAGGEPFISEVYLDLMEYIINTGRRNIRHVIQTNGSYLQKKSDLITRLLPFIKELRISFDAATEETYRRTRVNGQWDLLLSNVRWIMAQIQQNNLQTRVSADYVVQLDNYEEIPAFRELCNELGIKHINYQRMWNWHTWPEDELARRNVYNISHPLYFTVIKKLADVNDFDGQRLYQQLPPELK